MNPIASGSGIRRAEKRLADSSDENNEAAKKPRMDTYKTSKGLKDTQHGPAFQLKLLVLCLMRALSLKWNFNLATEIKEAENFDDILLMSRSTKKIHYRRYQLKHKQTESKCITLNNLFTETDGDYFLPKYFESYQLIKKNPDIKKRHREEQIEKIIDEFFICTNIDIDSAVKAEYFEKVENVDPILNFGGSRHKIKSNNEIIDKIFTYFQRRSKLHQLADTLIASIESPRVSAPLLLEYQKFLITEILVVRKTSRTNIYLSPKAAEFQEVLRSKGNPITVTEPINSKFKMSVDPIFENCVEFAEYICKAIKRECEETVIKRQQKFNNNINNLSGWVLITNANNEIKFSDTFLNNVNLPDAVVKLRKYFLEKFTAENLQEKRFKISKFPKVQETDYDSLIVTKNNVKDFLSKTVFAVTLPNEINLRQIIGEDLGRQYELTDSDLVASHLVENIYEWFKDKLGIWISSQKGEKIFSEITTKMESLIMIGASYHPKSILKSFNIEFKQETLITLTKTIENNQVTIMKSDKNPVLGPVKLSEVLMCNYKEQDSYTFMEYETILHSKSRVLTVFEKSRKLLIVEFQWDTNEKDLDEVYCSQIQNILLKNPEKKLILISKSESIFKKLTSIYFNYGEHTTEINVNEFSKKTREKILAKTVCFQGSDVSIIKLLKLSSNCLKTELESKIMASLPIDDLISGKNGIEIGVKLSTAVEYYIERSIQFPIIRKKILHDFEDKSLQENIIIINTPVNATKNEESITHWLKEVKPQKKLLWQQSTRVTKVLKDHLIKDFETGSLSSTSSNDFLTVIKTNPFILISEEAGMGKSTLLTHFASKLKEKYKSRWIYRMNLNDHAKHFLDAGNENDSKWEDILCTKIMKLNDFEKSVFKYLLRNDRVVLLMDGFDEINPDHDANVYGMIKELRKTGINQIWLTTRPHLEEDIEKKLNQLPFRLKSFTKVQQRQFLERYWQTTSKSKYDPDKIKEFASFVLENLPDKMKSDKVNEFGGLPLHMQILAEIAEPGFENFLNNSLSAILPKTLIDLYGDFVKMKLKIFHNNKCIANDNANVASKQRNNPDSTTLSDLHEKFGMQLLFSKDRNWAKLKEIMEPFPVPNDDVYRFGIIRSFVGDTPRFIHRTYAEYFSACFIVKKMTSSSDSYLRHFVPKVVLSQENNAGVRAFIEDLLQKKKYDIRKTGIDLKDQHDNNRAILTIAIKEGNISIMKFLLNALSNASNEIKIEDLLKNKNNNVWTKAIQCGRLEVVQELWNRFSEADKTILIRTNSYGHTWNLAVEKNETSILGYLWEKSKQLLGAKDASHLLFETRKSIIYFAVKYKSKETLKLLCTWAKEPESLNTTTRENLLRFQNKLKKVEYTPWHLAAHYGSSIMMQYLWNIVDGNLNSSELIKFVINNEAAWHFAAEKFHIEVLEFLWGLAEYDPERKKLLLQIWKIGANDENKDVIIKVWEFWLNDNKQTLKAIKDASGNSKQIIKLCTRL